MDLMDDTFELLDDEILDTKVHKRAKILVGVEWILGLCGTTAIILTLMFYLTGPNADIAPLLKYRPYVIGNSSRIDRSPEAMKRAAIYVAVLSLSVLVSSTIPVSLSILLAKGITQRSILKCKFWMFLHLLVVFGSVGVFIAEIFRGRRFHIAVYIAVGIGLLIRMIVMKLVVDFIYTVKEERRARFLFMNMPRFRILEKY